MADIAMPSGATTPTSRTTFEVAGAADVDAVRKAMRSKDLTDAEPPPAIPEFGEMDGGDVAAAPKGKLKHAIMTCDAQEFWALQDKGSVSNFITFLIMVVGIIGCIVTKNNNNVWLCIRALGLFGFSGGITNWLAVKMLFDRVPGLVGSGIITKQFKEIRQTVMDTVLETFFDAEFLANYIGQKTAALEESNYIQGKIKTILEGDDVDAILDKHLDGLMLKPEGMMLAMVGMTGQTLKPMVKPFVMGMDAEIAPMLTSYLDPSKMVDTHAIRDQVKELMKTKMEMLTPEMVKTLVEDMIRTHLGWLVVWGNLFGGLIGLVTQLISTRW
jgi:hypothetical protein